MPIQIFSFLVFHFSLNILILIIIIIIIMSFFTDVGKKKESMNYSFRSFSLGRGGQIWGGQMRGGQMRGRDRKRNSLLTLKQFFFLKKKKK